VGSIRIGGEDLVGEVILEEELAGVDLVAADVHLEMDVDGAAMYSRGRSSGR